MSLSQVLSNDICADGSKVHRVLEVVETSNPHPLGTYMIALKSSERLHSSTYGGTRLSFTLYIQHATCSERQCVLTLQPN